MIIERIHSGFLVAPDVKVTEVDKKTSELVGGYAGWVTDDTFFIGGGGYWLANQSHDREMAYGGLVVQWLAHTSNRFGYSAKGLVGAGRATLSSPLPQILVRATHGARSIRMTCGAHGSRTRTSASARTSSSRSRRSMRSFGSRGTCG